jgi:hypothetical protein
MLISENEDTLLFARPGLSFGILFDLKVSPDARIAIRIEPLTLRVKEPLVRDRPWTALEVPGLFYSPFDYKTIFRDQILRNDGVLLAHSLFRGLKVSYEQSS